MIDEEDAVLDLELVAAADEVDEELVVRVAAVGLAAVGLATAVDDVTVEAPPAPAPQTAGSVQAVPALAGATYVCEASTPGCLTT